MKTTRSICVTVIACVASATTSSAAVRYVNVNSTNATPPYTNWTTAATVIQDAVDIADPGDEVVVTNGVYQIGATAFGGLGSNRVAVTKPITVRSVNGPDVTIIRGYQVPGTIVGDGAIRCVYLTNGAALTGFTVTEGATVWWGRGGGIFCESTNAFVSNCVLSGNSAPEAGGGSYGGTLTDCTLIGNDAHQGGGACAATLIASTLATNFGSSRCPGCVMDASEGGGASMSVLIGCTLTGNRAGNGGGAARSELMNCSLAGNSADYGYGGRGGGVYFGTIYNCTLSGNSGGIGGGSYSCTLRNCALTANAAGTGGGVYGGTCNNCTVTGNSATNGAGGIFGVAPCFGYYCGPWCDMSGCSAEGGTFNNCIAYYNNAPISPNFNPEAIFNYSCTAPMPANGTLNITTEPELASSSHISTVSPCRGAGLSAYVSNVDIDGAPWASPPSIGCDEPWLGADTGPLEVAIRTDFSNVAAGFTVAITAQIEGNVSASRWEFGDGTSVSNRPYTAHAWAIPGDYAVVLRAFNQSFPSGVSSTVTIHVGAQAVHHVGGATATNPVPPYISWETAAKEIQEAIDVALPGDHVLVTNGVYRTGGRIIHGLLTNRIAVTKPITVRSLNGPTVTILEGYRLPFTNFGPSAVRCAYLTNGAELIGFTLSNGGTFTYTAFAESDDFGAGVWCESIDASLSDCILMENAAIHSGGGAYRGTLRNCTIARNRAGNGGGTCASRLTNCLVSTNSASSGGGVYGGTLTRCTLYGNSAAEGGGAGESTLNNCLLVGNSASYGGGAVNCTLNNCSITRNRADADGGGTYGGTLNNCILFDNTALHPNSLYAVLNYSCTTPLPTNGIGNITNAPLFVDPASGNFRLQSNSPCINAGRNADAPAGLDLDYNPRIVGGTVDMGAYEFQSPQSTLSYAWLQQYGLATDGSADFADPDGDGHNNWQEWRAGTDPTNSASVLRLLAPTIGTNGVIVRWLSGGDRSYRLERKSDLALPGFETIATNIIGQPGETAYSDTNTPATDRSFYRVRVEE